MRFLPPLQCRLAALLLASIHLPLSAQASTTCHYQQQASFAFSDIAASDTLRIFTTGPDCEHTTLNISITAQTQIQAQQQEIYHYSGDLFQHLPFTVTPVDLPDFIPVYINRLIKEAGHYTTDVLPAYSNPQQFLEDNNNILIISPERYELLRHQHQPVLWHVTDNSGWVYLIYDSKLKKSQVIMRRGLQPEETP